MASCMTKEKSTVAFIDDIKEEPEVSFLDDIE